jgi:hypothetical protein
MRSVQSDRTHVHYCPVFRDVAFAVRGNDCGSVPFRQRTVSWTSTSARIVMPSGLWISTSVKKAGPGDCVLLPHAETEGRVCDCGENDRSGAGLVHLTHAVAASEAATANPGRFNPAGQSKSLMQQLQASRGQTRGRVLNKYLPPIRSKHLRILACRRHAHATHDRVLWPEANGAAMHEMPHEKHGRVLAGALCMPPSHHSTMSMCTVA